MKFDFAVIGSGAGGALAAHGLQAAGVKTLIIEKGPPAPHGLDEMTIVTRYYRDQGFSATVGNTFIGLPTGEMVGGTTKINSGTCFDTPLSVVQQWERTLNIPLSHEELIPYFQKLKSLLSIQEVPEERVSQGNKLFVRGLQALGFHQHFRLRRNAKYCVGSGRCCFVCPKEAKQSTDVAVVPTFLKNGGTLFSDTEVVGITEERDRVVLRCKKNGDQKNGSREEKIECSGLIIAAGALATPVLVKKNKIGNMWKRAGRGLSIHPATKVLAQFSEFVRGWQGVPQAVGFKHPDFPKLSFEGVFTPPQLAGMVLPVEGPQLDEWLNQYEQVASFGVLVKDTNRGRVHSWPGMDTLVTYNLHPEDFSDLREGARFIGLAYLAAGAKKVLLPFNGVQNEFSSPEKLKRYDFSQMKPSQLYSMGFHPLGTCAMGMVVDHHLKVQGSQRIFIADGSVVPSSLGVNPQITIMALAMRLADDVVKQLS